MSMEKTEFLDQLRVSLNGKIDPQEVNENLRYYEDYINMQIRMGKSETEVMELLGSPRLIARSIMDAKGVETEKFEEKSSERERSGFSGFHFSGNKLSLFAKLLSLPKWLRTIVGIVVFVLFLWIVFILLKALLPALFVIVIVLTLAKFFRELK